MRAGAAIKCVKKAFLMMVFAVLTATGAEALAGDGNKLFSPNEIDKLDKNRAPEFLLKDLSGKSVAFSSFKGKVVLLNFWATWCPPCLAEMPSFKKVYGEMKSRGLEVIAISSDRSVSDTREFIEKKGLDFTVLMDESRLVTKQYKVFSLPTTFLIDRNGIIVEKFFGEYDWTDQDMRKKLEKLL